MNRLVELRRDRSRRAALPWTDARIAYLKARWSQGVTAQGIARELGAASVAVPCSGRFIGSGSLNSLPERGCIARISKEHVTAASPPSYGPRSAGPLRGNNGRPRPG